MGGNALDTNTERASPHHYLNVFAQVQRRIKSEWPEAITYLPRKHHYKQDHGDLDLLVRRDIVDLSREWVKDTFGVDEIHVNDGVWTFAVELPVPVSDTNETSALQVDLVTKRKEHWEMSKAFFDQSGLSNLCGKIARHLRYKWGYQGLRMPVYRNPDGERSVKYGEYVLTRDPRKAFEFIGFDYDRFQEGFFDLSEMFEYVIGSEFFTKTAFRAENLTADQKQRDRKRPVWAQFQSYIEHVEDNEYERPTQEEAIERAKSTFPYCDLHNQLPLDREQVELREEASEIFNGRDVIEEFGIEGKELGEKLSNFHDQFETDLAQYSWIVNNGKEAALELFAEANGLDR